MLVWYVGLDARVPGLRHHTYFFDGHLEGHLRAVFARGGEGSDSKPPVESV